MITTRMAAAVAWLALLGLGAIAEEAVPPSPGPVVHGGGGRGLVAGHFRLAAPDGTTVDTDDLGGKPYGVFFGFTHCPDICPTTLAELSMALARAPAQDLRIYFVSVDPERDTPEALARYMTSFDPRIVALSGTRQAVDEAVTSFEAVARRTDLPGGGYVYGHTAAVFLIDGDGLVATRIGTEAGEGRMADAIVALSAAPAARSAASSR